MEIVMQHLETTVAREAGTATVTFIGEGGECVEVTLQDTDQESDERQLIARAKATMIHLTAFGTRDGGGSVNAYDALSNGNLDLGAPLMEEPSPPPANEKPVNE